MNWACSCTACAWSAAGALVGFVGTYLQHSYCENLHPSDVGPVVMVDNPVCTGQSSVSETVQQEKSTATCIMFAIFIKKINSYIHN